jgi:heme A synthase
VAALFLATRAGTGKEGLAQRATAFLLAPRQAWRAHPALHPLLPRLAGWAILVYLAQAGLGALTVLTGNRPWATTMHMGLAVVWFAIFVVAACIAYLAPRGPLKAPRVSSSTPHPAFTPGRDVGFAYGGEDNGR